MESQILKTENKLNKYSTGERILRGVVFVIFCLFAFSYVYLIFWCIYSGMREPIAFAQKPFGCSRVRVYNYVEVFTRMKEYEGTSFLMMLFNSLFFSFLGPLLTIFVTCKLAYATSKYKFFGAGAVYYVVLIVMTLPVYGTQTAMYKLLHNLGLLNSRAMIITSLNGFSIYYMYFYAFFRNLSWSYAEAAQMDGANPWQILYSIMLPQTFTMFGSLFIMMWVVEWNAYATALIYLPKMPTLAVGIYDFQSIAKAQNRMDLLYAACTISMIPPLVLFMFCNNTLMSNVSIGGIKE